MTREQKVSTLIQYLKQENQGYASIPDPIDEGEQRRLLRSLMNVRYPGHASAEYEKLQDELLQEEAKEKGIVTCNDIPVIEQEYPCSEIKNSDRISLWRGLAVTEKQKEQLKDCYLNCLKVAEKSSLKSIAFCCISTGEFHFPNKLAAEIAVDTVDRFLTKTSIEHVIFNVFKEQDFNIYKKLFC